MASVLQPLAFDPRKFRQELTAFEELLKSKPDLSERDDILPFFKENRHLTAYIGTLYLKVAVATHLCFEFDIAGDFRADVLLGSQSEGKFCIVEFESGANAIFKNQSRKNPEWSSHFEHGFSQIVDWLYDLADQTNTATYQTTFGHGEITFAGLLVMGRDAELDGAKRRRLKWRSDRVLIDSHAISCLTFDELHASLKMKFEFYEAAAASELRTQTDQIDRITIDPEQCGGRPCVRGMRIRVSDVLDLLAAGLSAEQVVEELPDLELADVWACLQFASRRLAVPETAA